MSREHELLLEAEHVQRAGALAPIECSEGLNLLRGLDQPVAEAQQFGYMLLWVILVANLMAMLLQGLAAKLGIATGMNLAEMCRAHFSDQLGFSRT